MLYFYQSGGRLKRPLEVPEDVFLDELQFYEISEETILEYKIKEGFLIDKVWSIVIYCDVFVHNNNTETTVLWLRLSTF